MNKKKIIIGILIIAFFIIICSILGGGENDTPKEEIKTQEEIKTEVTTIANKITGIAEDSFSNCETNFDYENKIVTIKIVTEGSAYCVFMINGGDTSLRSTWNTMVDNFNSYTLVGKQLFKEAGYNDYQVHIVLMNDMNTDNTLFWSIDGSTYYSAVK